MRLRPDLVWLDGAHYVFVGDAKYKRVDYKRINDERVHNADLYQMLRLRHRARPAGGLLVYAKGEADVATYRVRHSGKRLEVAALDLSGTLDDVLKRVGCLAEKAQALRIAA